MAGTWWLKVETVKCVSESDGFFFHAKKVTEFGWTEKNTFHERSFNKQNTHTHKIALFISC